MERAVDLSNGMTMTDHQQELFDRIMSKGDHEGHPWMSHINNVEFLLAQKDFDINFTYYGQTPLWIACSLGILGCVTQLAEAPFVGGEPNPIDLEKPSSAGETPLYAACRAGHVKVAQYLVERVSKACLDAPTLDARTPLWIAAHNGHAAVVELLLSQPECDAGVADGDGCVRGRKPARLPACPTLLRLPTPKSFLPRCMFYRFSIHELKQAREA